MEHTKTPWRVNGRRVWKPFHDTEESGGVLLTEFCTSRKKGEAEACAEYAVRAVNAHEKLVEAVETLLSITKSLTANYETCDLPDEIDDALEFAEEALALAEK